MLRNTNGRPVGGEGTSSQPWRVEILSKTRTLGQAGSTRSRQSMPLLVPTHLFHILQSYAALVPPQYLQCSTNGFHDFVVEFVFDNPHFKLYPPSRKYQCTFWRWAIHELETIAANEARSIHLIKCTHEILMYTHPKGHRNRRPHLRLLCDSSAFSGATFPDRNSLASPTISVLYHTLLEPRTTSQAAV